MKSSDLTPQLGLLFRITHLRNVPWLLANGIYCGNSGLRDPDFIAIGDPKLIAKRASRDVPIDPGGTLADYVPFYFTPWSPMLLNITTGHDEVPRTPVRDIAILVARLDTLASAQVRVVMTDRHAYLPKAKFTLGNDGLAAVDWKLLQARDFKRDDADPGKLERYQAEALVHRCVPAEFLSQVVVHDVRELRRLQRQLRRLPINVKLIADSSYYFR